LDIDMQKFIGCGSGIEKSIFAHLWHVPYLDMRSSTGAHGAP